MCPFKYRSPNWTLPIPPGALWQFLGLSTITQELKEDGGSDTSEKQNSKDTEPIQESLTITQAQNEKVKIGIPLMNQTEPKWRGRLFRDKNNPYWVLRWRDKSRHWSLGSVGPACSGLHEKLGLGERLTGESQVPDVEHTQQADRGCCQQI